MIDVEAEVQTSEVWAQQIADVLHNEGLIRLEDLQRVAELIAGFIDMRLLIESY